MRKIQRENIKKILLIRRDNIGDLICTTPAIHALRESYPDAMLGVLVNSYNAHAVINNPDIDKIHIYEKFKHVYSKGRYNVWSSNARVLFDIRNECYDVAIGCSNKYSSRLARYAFLTGARYRIGYLPAGKKSVYYNLPLIEASEPVHEVISVFRLLASFGIEVEPSKLVLMPSKITQEKVITLLQSSNFSTDKLVAVHISSRKPNNKWPKEKFAELINKLVNNDNAAVMLLWAPGSKDNPYHPGDDEDAEWIRKAVNAKIFSYHTERLDELIAALSIARLVICCDGGAMHITAALGKPILTIWGSTDKRRWAPWKVDNIILQKGKTADEITAEEVMAAFEKLWR